MLQTNGPIHFIDFSKFQLYTNNSSKAVTQKHMLYKNNAYNKYEEKYDESTKYSTVLNQKMLKYRLQRWIFPPGVSASGPAGEAAGSEQAG